MGEEYPTKGFYRTINIQNTLNTNGMIFLKDWADLNENCKILKNFISKKLMNNYRKSLNTNLTNKPIFLYLKRVLFNQIICNFDI